MRFCGLSIFVLLMCVPFQVVAAPAPRLVAEAASHDFGVVEQGEKVEHTFVFRNEGDAPLSIERVKSSCSCTATLVSDQTIPPGGSGSIQATFDSTRFRGKVHKTIFLYSNDPQRPSAEFLLTGEVAVILQTAPLLLNFGAVAAGSEARLPLLLKNVGDRTLRIVNLRTSNAALQVVWTATELAAGAEMEVTVVARPENSTTNLSGAVLIRSDRATLAEFEVPVRGSVLKP